MFAACDVAEADDFDLIILEKQHILAAIARGLKPLGPEHQGRGLCTAGGQQEQGKDALHTGQCGGGMVNTRLMRGE